MKGNIHNILKFRELPELIQTRTDSINNDLKAFENYFNNPRNDLDEPIQRGIVSEVNSYFIHPPDSSANPLEWWKVNSVRFPRVALMARMYLASQPTSAAAERLFSDGGLVVTDRRRNLDAKTISALVFLRGNLDLLQ